MVPLIFQWRSNISTVFGCQSNISMVFGCHSNFLVTTPHFHKNFTFGLCCGELLKKPHRKVRSHTEKLQEAAIAN